MSDFETVREALVKSWGLADGPELQALARIEAEVERLRAQIEDAEADADEANRRIVEMQTEVERLRFRAENCEQSTQADVVTRLQTEVERLRAEGEVAQAAADAYNEQAERLVAKVEGLRAALERIDAIDHMRLGWGEELQRIARAALAEEVTPIHTDP